MVDSIVCAKSTVDLYGRGDLLPYGGFMGQQAAAGRQRSIAIVPAIRDSNSSEARVFHVAQ